MDVRFSGAFEDGTVVFHNFAGQRPHPGGNYAVFRGEKELGRIQFLEVKEKFGFAKPLPGSNWKLGIGRAQDLPVSLQPLFDRAAKAESGVPLPIERLDIDVKVLANRATTTFTTHFRNGLGRKLDGQLRFPLTKGMTVSRLAMGAGGNLLDAIMIENPQTPETYQFTDKGALAPKVLRTPDPQVFETPVHHIPPRGTKMVVVTVDHALQDTPKGFFYKLPLGIPSLVGKFSFQVEVGEQVHAPVGAKSSLGKLHFRKTDSAWVTRAQKTQYHPNETLAFLVPKNRDKKWVFTEAEGDKHYFYLLVEPVIYLPVKAVPKRIVLLWDASFSARKRNIQKELALLGKYFAAIGNVEVRLVVLRNEVERAEGFRIKNGRWRELRETLQDLPLDGGTQLGALDLSKYSPDEFLLFSDGVSTFGKSSFRKGKVPFYTINSSLDADPGNLDFLARSTGGAYVDLTRISQAKALRKIGIKPYSFLRAKYDNTTIRDTYPWTAKPVDGPFSLSGILHGSVGVVQLEFGTADQVLHRENVRVNAMTSYSRGGMVKRLWANEKIAELRFREKENSGAIAALGKEFSLATPYNSFLVPKDLEDYITHRAIPPTPGMKSQYYARVNGSRSLELMDRRVHLRRTLDTFEENMSWLQPVTFVDLPEIRRKHAELGKEGSSLHTNKLLLERLVHYNKRMTPAQKNDLQKVLREINDLEEAVLRKQVRLSKLMRRLAQKPVHAPADAAKPVPAPNNVMPQPLEKAPLKSNIKLPLWFLGTYAFPGKITPASQDTGREDGDVLVKRWDPSAPYLDKLEAARPEEWYGIYLQERKEYGNNPGFYFDTAGFFALKKNSKLTFRILSNITELGLQNPQLLRILGYHLQQMRRNRLAITVFRDALRIGKDDPQSYRDLALALADSRQYQEAVELLWKIIEKDWGGSHPEIQQVALDEFNAIVSLHADHLDMDRIDKRFIGAMPVDARVVLTWDSPGTDLDLWVTGPDGEKCTVHNARTKAGGVMSKDFSQGYGPEVFKIHTSKPGKYIVEVDYKGNTQQHLAGATSIRVDMTVDYGRENARTRSVMLRPRGENGVVTAGDFWVGGK